MGFEVRSFPGFLRPSAAPCNLKAIPLKNTYTLHGSIGHRPRKHAHSLTSWPHHEGQVNNTPLVSHSNTPPNLPARRRFIREPQYTDSRTVGTDPARLGPMRPKPRKSGKGSRG